MAALPDVIGRSRLTRDDVRLMEEQGLRHRLLGGRWELIDGELINKTGENPPHAYVLNMILAWLSSLVGTRLRCQSAIEVRESDQPLNEPQPDFAVLVEMKQDYASRLPHGDELTLIIEVANTSSRIDLSTKARLYARSGVPEY